MLFFVKSEAMDGKVDELTQKIISKRIQPVQGNQYVFLSPDGRLGFDIVEANDESDVRSKYQQYSPYMKIVEITQVMPAQDFYRKWQQSKGGGFGLGSSGDTLGA
jgi:hypothetical protein